MRIHQSVLTGVLVYAVLVLGFVSYHKVLASGGCTVKQGSWNIDEENDTASASFTVDGGAGCQQDVSVMSWNADPDKLSSDEFWTTQTINDVQTQTLSAGTHTVSVKIPHCSGYQADVIAGKNPSPNLKPP